MNIIWNIEYYKEYKIQVEIHWNKRKNRIQNIERNIRYTLKKKKGYTLEYNLLE